MWTWPGKARSEGEEGDRRSPSLAKAVKRLMGHKLCALEHNMGGVVLKVKGDGVRGPELNPGSPEQDNALYLEATGEPLKDF